MKNNFVLQIMCVATLCMCISCDTTVKCPDCRDNPDFVKKEKGLAEVMSIQNVYVFVKTEPVSEYTVINTCKNDFIDQSVDTIKGKKLGKALRGLLDVSTSNIDFQKLLNHMVEKAKQEYPEAEGLIFRDNLSNCEVIKFK